MDNPTRLARPPAWESAFHVQVTLGGPGDSTVETTMNLFAFMMNRTWAANPIVAWLRDEWMMVPGNLSRWGPLLKTRLLRAPLVALPPSNPQPQSPTPDLSAFTQSSVSIEEVDEAEPGMSQQEMDELNDYFAKRRRLN